MARLFSSKDAANMIEDHAFLLEQLTEAIQIDTKYTDNIKKASDKLAARSLRSTLRGIPVEELNREKSGIRTKLLRDCGYCNMADLYVASEKAIADIKGIGDETARDIKEYVYCLVDEARKSVRISLSADRRSKTATSLVHAIAVYRKLLKAAKSARKLLRENQTKIANAIEDLRPAANDVKWFFSSRSVKQKATDAYLCLQEMLESEYLARFRRVRETVKKAEELQGDEAWEEFRVHSVRFFMVLEKINPGLLGADDASCGLPEALAAEIREEPLYLKGLTCSLRRYQEWGVKYILHQKRVLLGDEMGLGKTVQAIAAMVSLSNQGATHFAVVCPAAVIANWCREITKHSHLRAVKIHGGDRASAMASWIRAGGVAVTTYETTSYFDHDDSFRIAMLTVDEAHYIKNPQARRSVNTVNLSEHADRLLFLTGTAIENNVDEMIELIRILQPEVASRIRDVAFLSSAPAFREKIAPVYYRRKREDVLTELPDLIESKEWCTLTDEEEYLYEQSVLDKRYSASRRVSWNVGDLKTSSKAAKLLSIVAKAEADNRKVIVFSFFLDTVRRTNAFLEDRCLDSITGATSPERRQEILDEFEKAPAGTVLTAQIQAAGTGLNIQTASVIVFCEPQLKPSIENQAISRAYRMGQPRNVYVYRLLCEGTIDERIVDLLEEKQEVFNAFADRSEVAGKSFELDAKTFGSMIEDEISRIRAKYDPSAQKPEDSKHKEYQKQMKLSYAQLVQYLLKKYGPATEDYFTNDTFASKNKKISRTDEGLYCHHIDEDKAVMLSDEEYAKRNPFTYQKADHLVYCNLLEHLLLHVKIAEEPRHPEANENELPGIGGAVYLICRELNDFYDGQLPTQEWKRKVMRVIVAYYEDYIDILRFLWAIVQNDPRYESITKADLARGWHCNVIAKIYDRL